jgi:hypothetical protein
MLQEERESGGVLTDAKVTKNKKKGDNIKVEMVELRSVRKMKLASSTARFDDKLWEREKMEVIEELEVGKDMNETENVRAENYYNDNVATTAADPKVAKKKKGKKDTVESRSVRYNKRRAVVAETEVSFEPI